MILGGIAAWIAVGGSVPAAEGRVAWRSGAAFEEELASPIGVHWTESPLRRAVTRLSQERRIALFLDRRIDPDQKVDLSIQNLLPLEEVLNRLAEEHGFAVAWFDSIAYLGPPDTTRRLRTLALLRREEAHRLGPEIQRKFLDSGPLCWDDLATPRELLTGLAEQNGLTIAGMDQIPHDLWAAADLPSMPLIDRFTLLAIQFDLTFQISPNGPTLKLVPAPDDVSITREYPAGRQAEALAAKWAGLLPDSRIRVSGGKIVVRGSAEDQDRIASWRRGSSPTPRKPSGTVKGDVRRSGSQVRHTVPQTRGPLGVLLKQLTKQLGRKLRIDEEGLARAGISLEQNVPFAAENATEDELFTRLLKPAGLSFRRAGNVIEVGPAE